jgi:hypothetical protein
LIDTVRTDVDKETAGESVLPQKERRGRLGTKSMDTVERSEFNCTYKLSQAPVETRTLYLFKCLVVYGKTSKGLCGPILTVYLSTTLLFTVGERIQIRPSTKYVRNYFIVEYWKIKKGEKMDRRKIEIKEKLKQRNKKAKNSRTENMSASYTVICVLRVSLFSAL